MKNVDPIALKRMSNYIPEQFWKREERSQRKILKQDASLKKVQGCSTLIPYSQTLIQRHTFLNWCRNKSHKVMYILNSASGRFPPLRHSVQN